MQPSLTPSEACYCLKIRKTSASITQFYDRILEPCGVTVRQYSLLFHIAAAAGCSVRELADRTDLDRSTLARSLKPLYQRQLILDDKEPGTRNSRLNLTPSGRETLIQARQLWTAAQEEVEKKLGPEGMQWLERTTDALRSL